MSFQDLPLFNSPFSDLAPHIVDAFVSYHRENPKVYELFKRFACEAKTSGRRHYGAKALMEKIRWHIEIEQKGEFKINNSFTSAYVRALITEDPSFKDFFQTRQTPGTVQ